MKVIKVPFSGGGLSKGKGANLAPEIIVNLVKDIYSNEDAKECKFEFEDLDLDENNILESHDKIEKKIFNLNEKAILIGGDHSISYSSVKGFAKNNPEFNLIVFDAHPDLMEDFEPPTHESYLRNLIENKIVLPEDVLILGIRNWDKIEIDYLNKKNIKYYTCKEIFKNGIKETIKEVLNFIKKPIYLSIDIDVVDPIYAPGTGYIEHGGLTARELIYSIQEIKNAKKILMADIVEVNPTKDINNNTSILATKILAELYGF